MRKDLVIVAFSVMCMVLCVSLAVCACECVRLSERLGAAENELERVTRLVEEHDEVMMTYRFFNEKWASNAYREMKIDE